MNNNQIVRLLNNVLYDLDHSHTERSNEDQRDFAKRCELLEEFKETFINAETEYREKPRKPLTNAQLERIVNAAESIAESFEQAERTGFNVNTKTDNYDHHRRIH